MIQSVSRNLASRPVGVEIAQGRAHQRWRTARNMLQMLPRLCLSIILQSTKGEDQEAASAFSKTLEEDLAKLARVKQK